MTWDPWNCISYMYITVNTAISNRNGLYLLRRAKRPLARRPPLVRITIVNNGVMYRDSDNRQCLCTFQGY